MLLSASVGKSRRAIGDGASGRIFVSFHPDCSEPRAHWGAGRGSAEQRESPVKGSQRPPQHDFQVGGLTVALMGIFFIGSVTELQQTPMVGQADA
jgi:hypothetical protein